MYKLVILSILAFFGSACQDYGKLSILHSLPSVLHEISGMETANEDGLLWCVNDSGNDAVLYLYDPNKNDIVRQIEISNARNEDWEDLATDNKGTVYIGDFGNNSNKRRNLTIYTVSNALQPGRTSLEAIKTTFSYEDQDKFPPKKKDRNFDVEAFIYLNDHFYLFTRNRSSKFDGTTKLYRLPARAGNFEAKLIDSFRTCGDPHDCMITSATIDPESGKLALLTYNKVWILSEYENDDFFKGKIEEIKLEHSSQKESLCFYDSSTLLIADEANGLTGAKLYKLKIE